MLLVTAACIPPPEGTALTENQGIQRIVQQILKSFTNNNADFAITEDVSEITLVSANVSTFAQVEPMAATPGNPNEECPADTVQLAKFNYQAGSYVLEGTNDGGVVITGDAISGTWTSTEAISHVLIKGANDVDTVVYASPTTSGSFNNSNIFTPNGQNNADISNIKFCGPEEELGTIAFKKVVDQGNPNNPDQTFVINYTNGIRSIGNGDIRPGGGFVGRTDIEPGNWTIRELQIPANWTLSDLTCTSRDGTSTIGTFIPGETSLDFTLASGDRVNCIFTNIYEEPALGSITIMKNVDDDSFADMDFDFTFDGGTNFSVSENGIPFVVTDLPAGTYTVTEVVPADWDLTSISCGVNNNTGTTDGINIVLEAGEDEVCTFNNTYEPRVDIRVIKYHDLDEDGTNNEVDLGPSGPPTGATLTGWEFVLYDSGGNEVARQTTSVENPTNDIGVRTTFSDLSPNETYTICEVQQSGWTNTEPGTIDATYGMPCKSLDASGINNFGIIYFGNHELELGSITIMKNVDDDSFADMDFDFTFDGGTNFSVSENGTPFVVTDLPAGTYTVTEVVPADWDLTSISCGVNNNTGTTDGINIVLEAGEDEVCTFNNTYDPPPPPVGSITIVKNVNDDSFADMDFDFTFDGSTNFSISENDGPHSFGDLVAGTYNITESVPSDWDLASIDCGPNQNNTSATDGINVVLEAGEDVMCTFNNAYDPPPPPVGSITIVKNVDNDSFADMDFDFTFDGSTNFSISENDGPHSFGDLVAGTYNITENVPSDWDLASVDCGPNQNNTSATDGINVVLEAGEEVMCTFNNAYDPPPPPVGSITVVKNVDDDSFADMDFDFTFNGSTNFSISENDGPHSFGDLVAGTYNITESVPSDWDLASIDCGPNQNNTSATDGINVVLEAGEEVMCTFNNTYDPPPPPVGSVSITKVVYWNGVPVDNNQTFQLCLDSNLLSAPECQAVGANGGSITWEDLELGTYYAYELDPGAMWQVSGAMNVTLTEQELDASVTITNARLVIEPLTLTPSCPAGTLIVTNPNDTPVTFTYNNQSSQVAANASTTINVQPGESVTITFEGGSTSATAKTVDECGTISPEPSLTCPADFTLVGEYRSVLGLNHPNVVFERSYDFNLGGEYSEYEIMVLAASSVGHPENGCLAGGGNDAGGTCDQGQNYESFNILIDESNIANIPDHGEDKWQSFGTVYSSTILSGDHTITFRHVGIGSTPESVTYKGAVCARPAGEQQVNIQAPNPRNDASMEAPPSVGDPGLHPPAEEPTTEEPAVIEPPQREEAQLPPPSIGQPELQPPAEEPANED
ncbi:hypothetical protein G4Y79_05055 [Phototrophicus methaneseepsis]|uniref:SpaA-like prealbumin fold domain-containing protein n=1 Tax=Phototrophicus methaneseepsis TaxID=2710758 RepID=A0A7S8EB63_9CHLR|nr:DUF5979 domain-containing protein [Phototrophicus methaneseepsis]QPC83748.1 hypothetical protein G4Y79_05055 [Phototrophicus methaneseepsis]